jgi:hypothetical protein
MFWPFNSRGEHDTFSTTHIHVGCIMKIPAGRWCNLRGLCSTARAPLAGLLLKKELPLEAMSIMVTRKLGIKESVQRNYRRYINILTLTACVLSWIVEISRYSSDVALSKNYDSTLIMYFVSRQSACTLERVVLIHYFLNIS